MCTRQALLPTWRHGLLVHIRIVLPVILAYIYTLELLLELPYLSSLVYGLASHRLVCNNNNNKELYHTHIPILSDDKQYQ